MFREALTMARRFTWPVVLSKRDGNGVCASSIGSCVVLNRDGWIATAYHLLAQFTQLKNQTLAAQAFDAESARLNADTTLEKRERQRQIRKLPFPAKTDARDVSIWWGHNGCNVTDIAGIEEVDLAVGRLEPFDASWVGTYPVFKDPSRDFEPGVSLCKLGFPFHEIKPTWDSTRGAFVLPPGALPMPLFPIDGIFTRTVQSVTQNTSAAKYPHQWIETSSPGLRGQSGGPTFDTKGTIWGIQVRTAHYPLGFDDAGAKGQFLNVGLGVHPATMLPFFDEKGIKYELSDY